MMVNDSPKADSDAGTSELSSQAEALERYLLKMTELGASDLFLRPARPPVYHVNGRFIPSDLPVPTDADMQAW